MIANLTTVRYYCLLGKHFDGSCGMQKEKDKNTTTKKNKINNNNDERTFHLL